MAEWVAGRASLIGIVLGACFVGFVWEGVLSRSRAWGGMGPSGKSRVIVSGCRWQPTCDVAWPFSCVGVVIALPRLFKEFRGVRAIDGFKGENNNH